MNSEAFDSLTCFDRLKNAGMPEAQARVQADTLRELIDSQLATKRDLRELEYKLTIRLGGITVACAGLVVAILSITPG